ncbi:hypothetical protein PRIEUP_LOCUS1134, partial [Pristimantis euphronides]
RVEYEPAAIEIEYKIQISHISENNTWWREETRTEVRVRSLTSKMWKLSVILLISAAALYMIDAQNLVHKCPENKIWSDCGTICTPNCATIGVKGRKCPFSCLFGGGACTCRSPYVFLSGKSGPCVLPKDCPKNARMPKEQSLECMWDLVPHQLCKCRSERQGLSIILYEGGGMYLPQPICLPVWKFGPLCPS